MHYVFHAESNPSSDQCAQISSLSPDNPFYTPLFVAARSATGTEVWILYLSENGKIRVGCTAFIASGRFSRSLEIDSVPDLPIGSVFWDGLRDLCRDESVTELTVNSFASRTAVIPSLAPEVWRHVRCEFVLDLHEDDFLTDISTNHKRNIRRAQKGGVTVRAAAGYEACRQHTRLVAASMSRRRDRGEKASGISDTEAVRRLTESGAGTLYQATLNDGVLSSVLVLRSATVGYYHSAGTSPEGMALGASHFLILSIAERLRAEASTKFNLGGASSDEIGLRRFKADFGTVPVELEAVKFFTGGRLKQTVLAMVRGIRSQF